MPQLTVEAETGERLPFDDALLYEFVELDLRDHAEDLRGFRYDEGTRRYSVDVSGDHLSLDLLGEDASTNVFIPAQLSRTELAVWLRNHLPDPGLNASAVDAWVLHALSAREQAGISLAMLHRGRFVLLRLLSDRLRQIQIEARRVAYQKVLFSTDTSALTTDEWSFRYPEHYTPRSLCRYTGFRKHYYRQPGELDEKGEELQCAVELDHLPGLKHWVRNLAGPGRETSSFWLQTWTHRFYPDFVAELEDGRFLVVEYKGQHLEHDPDELAKKELGEFWAARSGGRAIFVWAVAQDSLGRNVREQLHAAIESQIIGLRVSN